MVGDVGLAGVAIDSVEDMKVSDGARVLSDECIIFYFVDTV